MKDYNANAKMNPPLRTGHDVEAIKEGLADGSIDVIASDHAPTGANSRNLAYVISAKTLNRLKEVAGYMIIYTHLGWNSDCPQYICIETQNALRNLAMEFKEGKIYVTTTSKLLKYYINQRYLHWSYESKEGTTNIYIYGVKDPIFGSFVPTIQDLEEITFYVPDKNKATIYLKNKRIENVGRNPTDHTKMESSTITAR